MSRFWYRLKRRFARRPAERCETCGKPTRKPHEVIDLDLSGDPEAGFGSGSSMSALYCQADCPGGCQYDHAPKEHTHAA